MEKYYGTVIVNTAIDNEGQIFIIPMMGSSTVEMISSALKDFDEEDILSAGIYDIEDSNAILLNNEYYEQINPEDIMRVINKHRYFMRQELQELVDKINDKKERIDEE